MKRNARGVTTDASLLDIIKNAPGLSMYELTREADWTIGRVDGAVRRLLRARKVVVEVIDRNGRMLNLLYPARAERPGHIEVPIGLLKIGNPTWQSTGYVYGLDSNTIGISGKRNEDWETFAPMKNKVDLEKEGTSLALELPQGFLYFYRVGNRHVVKTINGNDILLTVSGNIVETKKYPS